MSQIILITWLTFNYNLSVLRIWMMCFVRYIMFFRRNKTFTHFKVNEKFLAKIKS